MKESEPQASKQSAHEREQTARMAALSHEFKTPLSVTLTTMDLLQKKLSQQSGICMDEYNVLFGIASRNLYKVLRMANNFIDADRLENGVAVMRFCEEDLVRLLQHIVEPLSVVLSSRNAEIKFVCKTQAPFFVQCDAQAIDRILFNLLSNAMKHLPRQNGRILLSLEAENELDMENAAVRICVTDNGSGLGEEAAAHLFERYWHDESESSVDKTSTGLGLYIVKALVELHGGAIAVHSEPYMATSFTVVLPRYQSKMAHDGILRSHAVPYDTDSHELLLRQELSEFME